MTDPTWLPADISLSVIAPITNGPNARDERELVAVVDQFKVESAGRYLPRTLAEVELEAKHLDPEAHRLALAKINKRGPKLTMCNKYVADLTANLGAPIPARLGGVWQDVRAQAVWLRDGRNGWAACDAKTAQQAANRGQPAVVVWDPRERDHGHIALLMPSRGRAGQWITQAGARQYRDAPIAAGFGALSPLEFFIHA